MGLLGDAWKARSMKDPVDGIAQVVGSTQPPDSATSSNVNLTLVVQAEGVPATTIEHSCIAPTKKWPYPGETLSVTFDRADPDRLKVPGMTSLTAPTSPGSRPRRSRPSSTKAAPGRSSLGAAT